MNNRLSGLASKVLALLAMLSYFLLHFYRNSIRNYLPHQLQIFMDVFPNFLGGISIPFMFIAILTKLHVKISLLKVIAICFFVGCWLMLEEYYPLFGSSDTFDYNDIVFSFLGVLIAFTTIKKQSLFNI